MILKLLGVSIIGCAFAGVYLFEAVSNATGFMRLLHWPAILLTGTGPIGLVLLCFDGHVIWHTLKMIFGRSPSAILTRHHREMLLLNKWGSEYYEEGPEVFDRIKVRSLSPHVRTMIERLAIRIPTKDIINMLLTERDHRRVQMMHCLNLVSLGSRLSPSMGMLGTILGMVRLLSTLEDPSTIGPSMSLALLTTFYGLFFSMLFWTPLQQKVERIADLDLEAFNQVVSWLETLDERKPISYFTEPIGLKVPAPTPNPKEQAA